MSEHVFLWACVVSVSARSECLHNRSFRSVDCAGARLCSGCTWPWLCWEVCVFHVPCSILTQIWVKGWTNNPSTQRPKHTHMLARTHARTYPHTLMHTHRQQWHAQVFLRNDSLDLCGYKVVLWRTVEWWAYGLKTTPYVPADTQDCLNPIICDG